MDGSIDEIWEKIHSSGGWGAYSGEPVIRFMARNFYNKDRRNVKVLDFGCGQGAHTWYLAREGFDTYAFDGSKSAVKKAEEKLRAENLSAHFRVTDAVDPDYPDEFFDAVIDSACIYSNKLACIEKMYRKIYNMLKPDGRLLSVCFGEDLGGYQTGTEVETGTFTDIKEGALADRGLTHIFTENEIVELIRSIGFENIVCDWCKYTDKGHMVHQYIIQCEK